MSNWRRASIAGVLGLIAVIANNAAVATPIDVTVEANLQKDPLAGSIFGYTSASVPVVFTFSFDDADATNFAAGATVNTSTGASFSTDMHLLSASSLTAFSATIGNQTFSSADLTHNILGALGPYDIALAGPLVDSAVVAGQFNLVSWHGILDFGSAGCAGMTCSISSNGYAEDDIEFSTGDLSDIRFTLKGGSQPTPVPEPGAFALAGVGLVALAMRRRRVV